MSNTALLAVRFGLIALGLGSWLTPSLASAGGELYAQTQGVIVATVVDEATSEPLKGVDIEILATQRAAVTDAEGRTVFDGIAAGNVTLRATMPGYGSVIEAVTVTPGEVAFLQSRLPPMEVVLAEIMVRARGDQGARALGHAEATVEEDGRGAAVTAADLLAEKVPGLEMYRPDGLVSGGASVRVRGLSSINAGNAPAIFLDGVRIDDYGGSFAQSPGSQAFHTLGTVPASEVRRIRVLRGPSATAQYAESANGVILIETRRKRPGGGGR